MLDNLGAFCYHETEFFMKRYSILSVGVDSVSESEFRARVEQWLLSNERSFDGSRTGRQIATVNPEFIMEAQANSRFRDVINAADCNLADGVGLEYASRILFGRQVFHRMTGVTATLKLCEHAVQSGKSVYFAGSGEGIARMAADVLQRKFPKLTVAGAETGIPLEGTRTQVEYTDDLIERINAVRPDILLVAFGAPKQELWIADNLSRMPSVKIAMGVGGTLDYLSGAVAYAPAWIRRLGLEWLYRLIREPRRWNRIITATVRFPLAVVRSRLALKNLDKIL